MESRRRVYYKEYTNMNKEQESSTNGKSTQQKNLKRKEYCLKQDDTQFVTKLRRANNSEYESTGLPLAHNLGEAPQKTEVLANLTPVQLDQITNEKHHPGLDGHPQPVHKDVSDNDSLGCVSFDDISAMHSYVPLDESFFENPNIPVNNSQSGAAHEICSPGNTNPPVNESLPTVAQVNSVPKNLGTYVNESLSTVSYVDSVPENLDPLANVKNILDTQSSFQIVTLEADVHDIPSRPPRTKFINNYEKKICRDEEVEICLQEIRNINDNIKEIPEETVTELNEIVIEIEQEYGVDNKSDSLTDKKDTKKRNSKKENKDLKYQYIDFLSDDECFAWSSSSWDGNNSDTASSDDPSKRKKLKKKQLKKKKTNKKPVKKTDKNTNCIEQINADEEIAPNTSEKEARRRKNRINISKERSRLRNSGQEYITKTGKVVEEKKMKENPCQLGKCPNQCFEIGEEKRCNIFKYYWGLSKERRADWIVSHTKKESVKRKRTKEVDSRRQWSHSYFINDGEGQKKVCLKFLLNTLDVRQRYIHFTIESSVQGNAKDDRRGKSVPPNKTSENLIQSVRSYIENLPAVPSHYCRKNSKKCYLPQEFKNLTNLYRIYKQTKESEEAAFVGEKVFKNIFTTEFNISFHVPRKDKCIKCIKYENDPSDELKTEKEIHIQDKNETYTRFKVHQEANEQDPSVLCVTFDLQKVLNTPYGQSMLLYYSRKLAVYNLTFYESKTRQGSCYTWNETQGKRGGNEICTILSKYIEKVDSRGTVKHLLLYCDSCPGQNKNRIVMACLHQKLQQCKSIISIQINYLLPGHTYMPVDSMHAVIEKSVENTIIWAPSQWATVFSLARKSQKPYDVTTLTYKDFEAWDAVAEKYFKGNLIGKISKIRTAIIKKKHSDKMFVKYSMAADAETDVIETTGKKELNLKKTYKSQLPTSKKKSDDLLRLCTNKTIPEMYHSEFKNLPTAANVQDVLPESDIEDEK